MTPAASPGVARVVFCLRRLDSLSADEFHRYWFERHGPLVAHHAPTLGIVRYLQLHPSAAAGPLGAAMSRVRGGPEVYDGVAEIWIDPASPAAATDAAKQAARELLDDERRFIDLARSPLSIYEPRELYRAPG